jgi:hypothetical protein
VELYAGPAQLRQLSQWFYSQFPGGLPKSSELECAQGAVWPS